MRDFMSLDRIIRNKRDKNKEGKMAGEFISRQRKKMKSGSCPP